MQIRIAALFAAGLVPWFSGCTSLNPVLAPPDENLVRVEAVTPLQPAELVAGDRLYVEITYERKATNPAVVFARAYFNGRPVAGQKAHPPVPCPEYTGNVNGWVAFNQPAKADEIRVTMLDNENRVVLAEERFGVDSRWRE